MSQDFNYPPTETRVLGAALEAAEEDLADAQRRVDELEAQQDDDDRPDPDASTLGEARSERSQAQNRRDALHWAVHGDNTEDGFQGWGEDAEVVLEAFTARSRARALDAVRNKTMGDVGGEETRIWLVAAAIQSAPFLDGDGDESLADAQSVVGRLPPALQDWLDDAMDSVNDISEGN
jgi:hypothetical protein